MKQSYDLNSTPIHERGGHSLCGRLERALKKDQKGNMLKQTESKDLSRRRLFAIAGLAGGAILTSSKLRADAAFAKLKQIDAGDLRVAYAEVGPSDGPVAMLLHGWPYDIYSYAEVAPLLASEGYRVIVPYLRGYGGTRFLSGSTVRNGQQAVFAVDTIALMDALEIKKAIFGGFDWGARTVDTLAAQWPERCRALVSVSGYLIGSQEANEAPLPPKAELAWWYQFYFATERGRAGYQKNRKEFAKLIWQTASPKWNFDEATFNRSAAALTTQTMSASRSTTTAGALA